MNCFDKPERKTRVVVDIYPRIGKLQTGINRTLEELERSVQGLQVEDIRLTSHQETSEKIVLVTIRYTCSNNVQEGNSD